MATRRLMLDYDGRRPPTIRRVRWILHVAAATRPTVMRIDRTRRGWHVVIDMTRAVSPVRVVMLQALLGSDWRRETFNARRVARLPYVAKFWRERANVLYFRHHRSVTV